MLKPWLLVALGAVLLASPAIARTTAQHPAYVAYENARFGYKFHYPADLFKALPEAENGDGRRFVSKDGRAEIAVWGGNAVLSPAEYLAISHDTLRHEGARITRETSGPWGFVISGTKQAGKIGFRHHYAFSGPEGSGQLLASTIQYPVSQSARYWEVVAACIDAFPRRAGDR